MLQRAQDHKAYDTHLNYIHCLCVLTQNVKIQHFKLLKKAAISNLNEKQNLIVLTKKSLSDEYKIVQIDQDYSYASTSWLPIKSYYLIFNILLTIEYIIQVQKSVFRINHTKCVEEFTRKLRMKEIQFSEPILNQVFDKSIINYKAKIGANLSVNTNLEDMYKIAIRKIARYKVEDWKQKNRINIKRTTDKIKYQQYLSSFYVSIFDFIYMMRIRSNYRDFSFINEVTVGETAKYFRLYFAFTVNLFKALDGVKKDLVNMRI